MTRRRWIANEFNEATKRAALTGENAHHLARVLRARVGQELDLACGDKIFSARVISVAHECVEFEIDKELDPAQLQRPIAVLLGVFKFDRMEWAIEKLTELGVSEIIPVIAKRTDSHLAAAASKRAERWRRIAHEASQQSRRVAPPEIAEPAKLKEVLAAAPSSATKILLWEDEQEAYLADLLRDSSPSVMLAIGPEGGWTDDEVAQFRAAGWKVASLGPTILRAETAAIAATAIAAALL